MDFPGGKHKDQIDALSAAYGRLIARGIFGVPESDFILKDTKILATWSRIAAIDITETNTSIVWAAFNPNTETMMVYDVVNTTRGHMASASSRSATA